MIQPSRLQARDLILGYGAAPVIQDLDIAIAAGEVVGLVGPNGAGKSTLIKGLAGLLPPQSGRIEVDGAAWNSIGRRSLAQKLGYIAQGGTLHWPMAVRDVVALGRIPYLDHWQRLGPADRNAVDHAIAATDIQHLADRPANELSGGEKMRVLLARALAGTPSILIADEPIAALDPAHQLSILNLLRAQAEQGVAILVALHDLVAAARFCDRIAVVKNGQLHALGPARDVLTETTLHTVFGVNSIPVHHEGMDIFLPWQSTDGKIR